MILVVLVAVLLLGCLDGKREGRLEGTVVIGPLCPVERVPPNPSCQPTQEVYDAWRISVFSQGQAIARLEPALDGGYGIELAPGTYTIDFEARGGRVGGSNLPTTIEIRPGEVTRLDIDIDTGIR